LEFSIPEQGHLAQGPGHRAQREGSDPKTINVMTGMKQLQKYRAQG